MTFEQYWYGEPELVKYYREAHDIRLEEQNAMMHLQGIYVRHAIGDFIEFYAMASKPKVLDSYPDKPYPITKRKKKLDEIAHEEEVANYYINMFKKQDEMQNKKIVGEGL